MSHLYIVFTENGYADPDGGLRDKITVKIGISDNPKTRFDQLQTSMHETLMAQTWKLNEPSVLEKFLHSIFDTHKLRGEWFEIPYYKYQQICGVLNSVSLYCACGACNGFYNYSRVAQLAIDEKRVKA